VDNLIAACPSAGVVDLQPLFFNLTLDSTTDLLFGRSVYSLRANIDQAADNRKFAESFNIAQEGLAKRFRIAPFHFLYNPSSFRNACRDVHRFVEQYIRSEEIMSLKDQPADSLERKKAWFVHEVAAESESERSLRDQLLNVLLAGRDTTACCLSWTL
jgi:cytochrome P450